MIIDDIYSEIALIIEKLVGLGISVHQNYPYRNGTEIHCIAGSDLSILLKNIKYSDKYFAIDKDKNYTAKLLDGGIIQMTYGFDPRDDVIIAHRLAFFPAPYLKNYEDDPQAHETEYYGESEFHDILETNIIKTPIRFDYSRNEKMYKDLHHPYSHLHIGEYETCRIPICSPISPSVFINFILRNFYNTALVQYCNNYSFPIRNKFANTISLNETNILHFNIQ